MKTLIGTGAALACLFAVGPAAASPPRTEPARARAFALHAGVLATRDDARGFCRLVGHVHVTGRHAYSVTHVSYRDCHEALFTTPIDRFKRGQFGAMGRALTADGKLVGLRRVGAGDYEVTAVDNLEGITVGLDLVFDRGEIFIVSIKDSGPVDTVAFSFETAVLRCRARPR